MFCYALLLGVIRLSRRPAAPPPRRLVRRDVAERSIQDTDAVIRAAGGSAEGLRAAADGAFIHAMHLTSSISAVILLVGVVVALRWLPGRGDDLAGGGAPAATTEPAERVRA